ncbi:hypothetical protein [Anoxybacillus flavithermus]|uniref:hypothetical protein n=1 Tax=Anoxybacillus flavithermus TaxID=33934 RepID=UPI0007DA3A8E|nr:hypothetical protein [Anoxybacillus flavithermus]
MKQHLINLNLEIKDNVINVQEKKISKSQKLKYEEVKNFIDEMVKELKFISRSEAEQKQIIPKKMN